MSTRDIVSKDKTDFETILQNWVSLTGISAMEVNLQAFVTHKHTHKIYINLLQELPDSFKVMM